MVRMIRLRQSELTRRQRFIEKVILLLHGGRRVWPIHTRRNQVRIRTMADLLAARGIREMGSRIRTPSRRGPHNAAAMWLVFMKPMSGMSILMERACSRRF